MTKLNKQTSRMSAIRDLLNDIPVYLPQAADSDRQLAVGTGTNIGLKALKRLATERGALGIQAGLRMIREEYVLDDEFDISDNKQVIEQLRKAGVQSICNYVEAAIDAISAENEMRERLQLDDDDYNKEWEA